MVLAPASRSAEPASSGSRWAVAPELHVLWIDTGTRATIFEAMAEEAGEIFGGMGVSLSVHRAPPRTPPVPGQLRITSLDRVHEGRPVLAGVTSPWRADGISYIWVFSPEVAHLAANSWSSLSTLEREHKQGRLLGRIVAHELVHALLPELPHARQGLMAAKLRPLLTQPVSVDEATRAAVYKAALAVAQAEEDALDTERRTAPELVPALLVPP
jgi:hypothetical protein